MAFPYQPLELFPKQDVNILQVYLHYIDILAENGSLWNVFPGHGHSGNGTGVLEFLEEV